MHLDNLDQKVISVNANDNCRIIIDGLAWVFQKGQVLKMWFPNVTDHDLEVSMYRGIGANPSYISSFKPPAKSAISITHNGASSYSIKPDFKKHVFKIDEFHANVKLKSNVKNLATNLQLKDTELKPILTDKRWFEIWKVTTNSSGSSMISKGRRELAVALGGFVAIAPSKTAHTKIEVVGDSNSTNYLHYPKDEKYTIQISNHCNSSTCENRSDFDHYYKIIDPNSIGDVIYKLDLIDVGNLSSVSPQFADSQELFGAKAPCNVIHSAFDPE